MSKPSPKEFERILDEIKELHLNKNHDYSANGYLSDITSSERAGITPWVGVLLRLQQKLGRLESFARQGEFKVADEKLEDTCKDIAVYSIIMLMLYKHRK